MAMIDSEPRHRNALPSIKHLDLESIRTDHMEHQRFSISSAPLGSPNTVYSGPPPPYSSAPATAGTQPGLSGYISPPHSTRRSTRDEKESPSTQKSLPSIQEALGEKSMSYTIAAMAAPAPTALPPNSSAHPTPVVPNFPDAPRGRSNLFSQPTVPASLTRETSYFTHTPPSAITATEPQRAQATFSSINAAEPAASSAQPFHFSRSPRLGTISHTQIGPSRYDSSLRSPQPYEPSRPAYPLTNGYSNSAPANYAQPREPLRFAPSLNGDEPRMPMPRSDAGQPYGEAVKRHLDVFDAELALNEIHEASSRTMDFSRIWSMRSNQANRAGCYPETLPGLHEVEAMMRESSRIIESLNCIREVIVAQQHALSEQRIRASKGVPVDDEYGMLPDEYKMGGGFGGGDAKKRRGKAAPPGRCHSCNRAETPEWRRGPDGARTLCNACGLHYAKLTRKMGANKAAAMGGSNLRPKSLDPRSPHI